MVNRNTTYTCEICGALYEDEHLAMECERKPITRKGTWKIGDIVKYIDEWDDDYVAIIIEEVPRGHMVIPAVEDFDLYTFEHTEYVFK